MIKKNGYVQKNDETKKRYVQKNGEAKKRGSKKKVKRKIHEGSIPHAIFSAFPNAEFGENALHFKIQ
jgi:hypothetical protein